MNQRVFGHHFGGPVGKIGPTVVGTGDGLQLRERDFRFILHHFEEDVSLFVPVENKEHCRSHRHIVALEPVFGVVRVGRNGATAVQVDEGGERFHNIVVAEAEVGGLVGILHGSIGLGDDVLQQRDGGIALTDVRVEGEVVSGKYPRYHSDATISGYTPSAQNVYDVDFKLTNDTDTSVPLYAFKGVVKVPICKKDDETTTYTISSASTGVIQATESQMQDVDWLTQNGFDIVPSN